MTLIAFAADRRAAVEMDRKATAPAAAAECIRVLQQSIDIACPRCHSSKPAARVTPRLWRKMGQTDRQTDRQRDR